MQDFVIYKRVSTEDQGASGLGLEAQDAAIMAYIKSKGGRVVAEFVEVASGGQDDRPELLKARAAATKHKATLIVSKLDRLSRDLAYIATFLKGEKRGNRYVAPDFVSCDVPHADKRMLQMSGFFAEWERERISIRTKDALAALKARGVKLGGPNLDGARAASAAKRTATANEGKDRVMLTVRDLQGQGITSLSGIAAGLNARGIATPRGGEWSAKQVSRLPL